jgi:hypothetical protein
MEKSIQKKAYVSITIFLIVTLTTGFTSSNSFGQSSPITNANTSSTNASSGFDNKSSPITPSTASQTQQKCDSSYPDMCIPIDSPDLDCDQIIKNNFKVLPPDRHRLDNDEDGTGCET